MHNLAKLMAERISAGLKRRSITSCSRWSCACRVLGGKDYPGPWTFKHHPWLLGMHDSDAPFNVGQKSAQMGYTETVLNRTFFKMDIEQTDCLYVLPAKTPDASDFSAARFDPALELSPHLGKFFSDVKNVGHKRAGSCNLYIRGSKSRSGLKSVPVGFLVLDEVEEMEQENIPLAMERQSGQLTKQTWAISTPSIDGHGISKLFQGTTQEHFYFKCPACSRFTELVFPDCLKVTGEGLDDDSLKDSYLFCKDCKTKLNHETKAQWLQYGQWVPSYSDREERGFYINQFYSPTVKPADIAVHVIKAQYNQAYEQELWNSKGGLPHTVEGARITDAQITACLGTHRRGDKQSGLITMGVDQGKWLHYWIDLWKVPEYVRTELNFEATCKTLHIGKCLDFSELDTLMHEFQINFCVIDSQPEHRAALKFASKFYGSVKLCFYARGVSGKSIHVNKVDDFTGDPVISVDRTSWLDMSLGRIRSRTISLPLDIPEEAKIHLKTLVRVYEKDSDGNPVSRYVTADSQEDHYGHSRNYSEIALPFAMGLGRNEDITESVT